MHNAYEHTPVGNERYQASSREIIQRSTEMYESFAEVYGHKKKKVKALKAFSEWATENLLDEGNFPLDLIKEMIRSGRDLSPQKKKLASYGAMFVMRKHPQIAIRSAEDIEVVIQRLKQQKAELEKPSFSAEDFQLSMGGSAFSDYDAGESWKANYEEEPEWQSNLNAFEEAYGGKPKKNPEEAKKSKGLKLKKLIRLLKKMKRSIGWIEGAIEKMVGERENGEQMKRDLLMSANNAYSEFMRDIETTEDDTFTEKLMISHMDQIENIRSKFSQLI